MPQSVPFACARWGWVESADRRSECTVRCRKSCHDLPAAATAVAPFFCVSVCSFGATGRLRAGRLRDDHGVIRGLATLVLLFAD